MYSVLLVYYYYYHLTKKKHYMCIVHTGGAFEVSTTTCRYYAHVCILDPCSFAYLFPRSVYALMLVYSCILMWFMCMIVNNIMCITHTQCACVTYVCVFLHHMMHYVYTGCVIQQFMCIMHTQYIKAYLPLSILPH